MDSRSLTPQQIEHIYAAVQRQTGYLSRLRRRIEDEAFPPGDRLRLAVDKAQAAAQELSVVVHYLKCEATKKRSR